jgi:carbamoyltransferase
MKILGISYGHNASVCLAEDGKITFIQSEERLNRIKNSTGFPSKTIEYINENICSINEIDKIIIFQNSIYGYKFLKKTKFQSVQYGGYLDVSQEVQKYFPKLRQFDIVWQIEDKIRKFLDKIYKDKIKFEFTQYIHKVLEKNIPVEFIEHHEAHTYSALPFITSEENWLIVTLDAAGDFLSGTVSEYKKGKISLLSTVSHTHSLGILYSTVTSILGMRAGEHEYKVMGLAPYADKRYGEQLLNSLRSIVKVTANGKIMLTHTPATLKHKLNKIFKNQRFDNVSFAIQAITEEILIEYIKYWVLRTGMHNIALAGGVFMNVKANMHILKMDMVKKLRVVPSSGDETGALGAAIYPFYINGMEVGALNNLYLGSAYSDKSVIEVLREEKCNFTYVEDIEEEIANLLSKGEIVARFKGRMEFGARALGNRSILANPSNYAIVDEINRAIKIRDFWMPFCPSILEEDRELYTFDYANKGNLEYMAIAVEGRPNALKMVLAASHPRDNTIRPQFINAKENPEYHKLVTKFKSLTGIGAVLNTSFNLHGEPNVCSPTDAIHTLKHSGLKYLAINNFLVVKQS